MSQKNIKIQNSYSLLPTEFYQKTNPEICLDPELVLWNQSLANDLNINLNYENNKKTIENIFSGNQAIENSIPLAMAYAGHQFGHFVNQLGDGRAHLLGEVLGADEKLYDIHLKGSGKTPFSRGGDGKAALGAAIREYVISEFLYQMKIPTTRSLCVIKSSQNIFRDQYGKPVPAAVLTRISESHIRVGTFEYFACRNDIKNLQILFDYVIDRHFADIKNIKDQTEKVITFFDSVVERQAKLIAAWMSVGFVHGVMNTDNASVLGLSIDFGPCAFLEEFKSDAVFSSIDRNGRYSYQNQPAIGEWNMHRLAESLFLLMKLDENDFVKIIEKHIQKYSYLFQESYSENLLNKMGLFESNTQNKKILVRFLQYLEKNKIDFTLGFRKLSDLAYGHIDQNVYHNSSEVEFLLHFYKSNFSEKQISEMKLKMNEINPIYIPRNHLLEKAIQDAHTGDFDYLKILIRKISNPKKELDQLDEFSFPAAENEKVCKTFCGT